VFYESDLETPASSGKRLERGETVRGGLGGGEQCTITKGKRHLTAENDGGPDLICYWGVMERPSGNAVGPLSRVYGEGRGGFNPSRKKERGEGGGNSCVRFGNRVEPLFRRGGDAMEGETPPRRKQDFHPEIGILPYFKEGLVWYQIS